MSSTSNSAATTTLPNSLGRAELICVGCGATVSQAAPDFRCAHCHNLLEVVYTGVSTPAVAQVDALKSQWRDRKDRKSVV